MKLFRTAEKKKSQVLRLRGYGHNQRRYTRQKLDLFWIQQYRQKNKIPATVPTAEVIKMRRKTRGLRLVTHKSAKKAMRKAQHKATCILKGTWGKKQRPKTEKVAA